VEDENVVTAARVAMIRIDDIFLACIRVYQAVTGFQVLKGCIKQIVTKCAVIFYFR
jgi:hypothetical protein